MVAPPSTTYDAGRRDRAADSAAEREPILRSTGTPVCVVGSGYIGTVIACVLASRGFAVTAVDVDRPLVESLNARRCPFKEPGLEVLLADQVAEGRLAFSTDYSAAAQSDVVIVTVGTPLGEGFAPDLTHVSAATAALAEHVRDGQLVLVKSTVPPGATRGIAEQLRAAADVRVAFSPERLAEGAAVKELLSLPIVVGGVDDESTEAASKFWRMALDVDVIEVSSCEGAELVKLADNLWIDLNVALAHDLAKLCDALPYSLDVLEIIAAANSLKKGQHFVNILTPSNGVGGYCLTKDPWFVHSLGSRHGLDLLTPKTSRAVNDAMPSYCADQIAVWSGRHRRAPGEVRIAVLGLAFKSNSGDVRLTPVAPLLAALRNRGFEHVVVHDPTVLPEHASRMGIELEPSMHRALDGANCVLFLAGHDAFRAVRPSALAALVAPGALVFDGRMYFDEETIDEFRALGMQYQGVGR